MASVDTVGASPTVALPSPKAYRQSRRRPAHLRTKTGCLTCRKRKKKCDELRKRCNNCTKQNIECIWKSDDQTPIQFPSKMSDLAEYAVPTGVPSLMSDHSVSEISSGASSVLARSAGHVSPANDEAEDCTDSTNMTLWRSSIHHDHTTGSFIPVPYYYSTAITPQSRNLFDFLKCKFLPELIRPAAYAHLIDSLSRETLMLALERPHCMHALLACCGAEIPTHDHRVRQLARFHYTGAVEGLRRDLNNDNIRSQWMVTMLTVMMLCIYERANPKGSTGVEVHLAGAARMIQLGAQEQFLVPRRSETEHAMYRLVQESFIFHVATSLPFQSQHEGQQEIDIAFQLAEDAVCPHFRPEDLFYSNSPVLGFPPKLFRCIYLTYRLHQRCRSNAADLEACQDLDQDLQQWNFQIKTLESGSEDTSGDSSKMDSESRILSLERPENTPSSPSVFLGQRLYILGCQILLYRMSSGDARSEPRFHGLIREAIDAVRALQPGYDYFAEYYCWPLLAIGMNLNHQADRELLMSKAHAFWIATNNGTMKRLVNILDLYWDSWKPFNAVSDGMHEVGEINPVDDIRFLER